MPLARARVLTCLALSGSGVMARIVDHLPVAALEARYRAARDVTEARHYQAIWLLAQGRSFLEVGEVMAFAPRWLEELAARYNTHGPAALGDQRRQNGRAASLLTKDVLAALAERVRTPPDDGGLWSGPKVAAWIAGQLGLERVRPCCMDQWEGRTHPYPVRGHAMRTDSGRPSSSMRFSAWTATSTSVARRWSVRERSPSPITCLNLPTVASTRARLL